MNNNNESKNGMLKGILYLVTSFLLGYIVYKEPTTGFLVIMIVIITLSALLSGKSPLFYLFLLGFITSFEGLLLLDWDFTNEPMLVYMGLNSIFYRIILSVAFLIAAIILVCFSFYYFKNQKHPLYIDMMELLGKINDA